MSRADPREFSVLFTRLLPLLLMFIAGFAVSSAQAKPLEQVTLQLKWLHQFQFAGYYAAKAKGFYEEAGLDVNIKTAEINVDPIQSVIDGKADFGVGTSELILHRAKGSPVVVLGVIFQHSPLNIITLADSGIRTIHDLAGRDIMIEHNSAELLAYLRCEGFNRHAFTIREHSFDTRDLIDKKVAAMSVYITDEPFELMEAGLDYQLFTPRSCAIDFYGDNLFTMETVINRNPAMVEAFRKASLRGWEYAMGNVAEMVELIRSEYPERHSAEHLRYEARMMRELMRPELIEPGYMNRGRWQHMAQTYQEVGLIDAELDVADMLYQEPGTQLQGQLRAIVLVGGSALLLCLLVLFTVSYFYRHLKASSNRLQTMFEFAPFSMLVLDESYRIQRWNQHAERTFLWTREEAVGKNLLELMVPSNMRESVAEKLARVLKHNSSVTSENSNLRKDGEEIICEWTNAPFQDDQNKMRFIVCIARDVTVRRRLEHELNQAAHYDNLTGLANRRLIMDLLKNAMATAKRMEKSLAVLFLDLDDFKAINDAYGHQMGDDLLVLVAGRLSGVIRESDYVGRLAGDEFLIILQDIHDRAGVEQVVDKIANAVSEPCHIDNSIINISVSIGVALYPEDGDSLDALILNSDNAMYRQKEARKNRR